VAITPRTKDADDLLRKELKHADLGKFKKAVKRILAPPTKAKATAATHRRKKERER
jgi:hypothetical protein